jgi:uncharacterized protein (TIGR02271 family)
MAEMEIHRNDRVITADGMEVGHVTHVIVDGPTRQVTDIVVDQDGHEWLVPLSAVAQSGSNRLMLRTTGAELAGMGAFDRYAYHALDADDLDERGDARPAPGTAALERASGDTAVIDDARGGDLGREWNDERLARREAGKDYSQDDANIKVPIVEEQLKAGVRETEAGRARIVKDVHQEQQTINVPVEREEVYVTERAVNRPATAADMAMREREIQIPLREQEVVAQKEARVTGEVNVRKETVTDTERVTDTVRREDVHVEGAESDRVHVQGAATRRDDATSGEGKTVVDEREYDSQGNLIDKQHYEEPGASRDR